MKYFLTTALLLLITEKCQCSFDTGVSMSESHIKVLSIYSCDDSSPSVELECDFGNHDGVKSLNADATIDEIIEGNQKAKVLVDKWTNGVWQNIYIADDSICQLMSTYASKAWGNLRKKAVPEITEECTVSEGTYTLKGFTAAPSDFNIPTTSFGTFRVTLKIFKANGELAVCQRIELQSDPM